MEGLHTNELYTTFQRYPLREKITGCPHCELDNSEILLHRHSLREVTWSDFGVYPSKAMTTFGDENDFKHFLPRLLELYASDLTGAPYGIEMLFGKLKYAHFEAWPSEEIVAVKNFVRAWHKMLTAQATDAAENWELEELQEALSEAGLEDWIA